MAGWDFASPGATFVPKPNQTAGKGELTEFWAFRGRVMSIASPKTVDMRLFSAIGYLASGKFSRLSLERFRSA
jgi:hypothetical protein